MNIDELVDKSVYILRETKAQFKNPCVLWSTGKDSTTILSLCKEAFFGEVPFPVVHIDTGWKFPEIYEFRDRIADEWKLDLRIARHPLAGKINPYLKVGPIKTARQCCQKLKTDALRYIIEKEGFDAVIVSIRRDEHYMRNIERVSSPRDKDFRWRLVRGKRKDEEGDAPFVSLQDAELWDILASDFGKNIHHVRRHPLLHWTELDVWRYIKDRSLPINPLYFSRQGHRYRSLGCRTCTFPISSTAGTVDEIIAELEVTKEEERAGRWSEKEKETIMRNLRALGYM